MDGSSSLLEFSKPVLYVVRLTRVAHQNSDPIVCCPGRRALWAQGHAAVMLDSSSPHVRLPYAGLATDLVVADVGSPRFQRMSAPDALEFLVEAARTLTADGTLVLLRQGSFLERARLMPNDTYVDVCAKTRPSSCRASGAGCVPLSALLTRARGPYANVFTRTFGDDTLRLACGPGASDVPCPRFQVVPPDFKSIGDPGRQRQVAKSKSKSAGRVEHWDVDAVLASSGDSWATRYERNNHEAWIWNYVGVNGKLPLKREWPKQFSRNIKAGFTKRILDAGAGTCSLDATLRELGLRKSVLLVSFGYYDCSMARVAAERGSLILDLDWTHRLPFCASCTFDLVFQAEGLHHVALAEPGDSSGNCAANMTRTDCRLSLWEKSFDNFDAVLGCGGTLFVTDLRGTVFDREPATDGYAWIGPELPRCWIHFGILWAQRHGYDTVRKVHDPPCAQDYPVLWVKKTCAR